MTETYKLNVVVGQMRTLIARFKVLKVTLLKIQIFWEVTQRRSVNIYRRFERSQCLHLQGQVVTLLGRRYIPPNKA